MIDYVDYNSQVCEQYMNQTITLEPGSYKYFTKKTIMMQRIFGQN